MNVHTTTDPMTQGVYIAILLSMSVVALILALSFKRELLSKKASRTLFATIVSVLMAALAYAFTFAYHPEHHDWIYFTSATISYLAIYNAQYLYLRYIVICINKQRNNPIPRVELNFTMIMCLASVMIWILSIGEGRFLIPEELESGYDIFFWISHAGEWALAISSALYILWYKRMIIERQMISLFVLPALLLLATLLEPLFPTAPLRYSAFMAGCLVAFTRYHLRYAVSASGGNMGLDSRFRFTANRMKPHFINNILSTIYYLCDMDIKKAQNTTMEFSGYMMGTLETIDSVDLIPFKREMGTVNNYLNLEKLRFEDRLNVEYDIGEENFEIPPLTIQSLVENAVKHGIANKEGPGTVTIATRHLADGSIQIKISDNGVGFDTSDAKQMNGDLAYIKDQLDSELGGKMSVKSAPGEGTTVTIKISFDKRR